MISTLVSYRDGAEYTQPRDYVYPMSTPSLPLYAPVSLQRPGLADSEMGRMTRWRMSPPREGPYTTGTAALLPFHPEGKNYNQMLVEFRQKV